ncbi:hypothetical protein LZ32DRAFT_602814, partial [Colletotrichum eremochloae]
MKFILLLLVALATVCIATPPVSPNDQVSLDCTRYLVEENIAVGFAKMNKKCASALNQPSHTRVTGLLAGSSAGTSVIPSASIKIG